MLYAIGPDGSKAVAVKGTKGVCPACRAALIPKCGQIKCHHWAHRANDCDAWYEPESDWHLGWKSLVRPEQCEVVMGPHRADIVGNGGRVIELQRSAISAEQIAAREEFYGQMVWLIDASLFKERLGEYWAPLRAEQWVRWRHPRQSLMTTAKKQYWDFGSIGIARVDDFAADEDGTVVKLTWMTTEGWTSLFLSAVLKSYRPPVQEPVQLGLGM